jgi:hypothetical protein
LKIQITTECVFLAKFCTVVNLFLNIYIYIYMFKVKIRIFFAY